MDYILIKKTPSTSDYLIIRKESEFGMRERESAERGLKNTWYGVYVTCDDKAIGMGRIVGDDGLTFIMTDIAISMAHQGQGLGKMIVEELVNYYKENAPHDAMLSLMAGDGAEKLYEKYGFRVEERYKGMKFYSE